MALLVAWEDADSSVALKTCFELFWARRTSTLLVSLPFVGAITAGCTSAGLQTRAKM